MTINTVTFPINLFEDMISSIDVIERIEELEDILAEYGELPDEQLDELIALRDLAKDAASSCEDWSYGATLIRESYFVEYAEDLIRETWDLDTAECGWAVNYTDWELVARDVAMDYSTVTFTLGGVSVDYYIR